MKPKIIIKGICVLLLAVTAGCTTGGFVGKERTPAEDDSGYLTLERIYSSGEFGAEEFGPAHWLKDGTGYVTLEDSDYKLEKKDDHDEDKDDQDEDVGAKDIVRYDPETGNSEIIVPAGRLIPEGESAPLKIEKYEWSADNKYLLIFTNTKRVWRQNTRGDYWVVDLTSWKLRQLGGDAKPSTLMFAKFSPDSRRVAYVRENNIYVENVEGGEITALTTDGSETIINGTFDWVYEEELDLRNGYRWSPDSKSIAYWQLDSEGVKTFHLINNTDDLYPRLIPIKYPKVGQTNSACRVGVVSADGGETRWLEVPGDSRNNYIARMNWAAGSEEIVLQHLNRLQNTIKIMLCDARTGKVREIFQDKDDAWVDIDSMNADLEDNLRWLDGGKNFTWVSEHDGWRHVYVVSRSVQRIRLITDGPYDIMDIQHVDKTEDGWLYFIASPDNPTQRYLYRARLNGHGQAQRISPADQPGTHSYQISRDASWAFHTYSNCDTPPITELVSLPEHKTIRTLTDNAKLKAKYDAIKKSPTEFFRIDIGVGELLDAWCIKPPDFDPSKKYPLLFYVYGEPAGQTVLDNWGGKNNLWYYMLAQQGYVIMSVDNRGTPAPRGRDWRKIIYRQIGILASHDQAAAAREIIKTRPYIDPDRIAVWGWSGGGSMSLNLIFRYPEIYSTAMAIAFISNQRLYDTIYQERYMSLPDDNEEGFTNRSPVTHAHKLQGNLLIIHGTADDNCHYQSFETLVNELIKHNKRFSMMSYPNRTHAIKEGKNTTRHLFETLTWYLTSNVPPGARRR